MNKRMRYRKKPVEIEAIRFPEAVDVEGRLEVEAWIEREGGDLKNFRYVGEDLYVGTYEGEMIARPGDFIICGVEGEFYPCKPSVFWTTYEEVK